MNVMEIVLTPELDQFVVEQVNSGRYPTPSAVVSAGVRMLQDRQRQKEADFAALKAKIQAGRDDFEAGRFTTLDENTFDEIRAMGEALLAKRQRQAS
jgi:putative addiction module CopG family antidote